MNEYFYSLALSDKAELVTQEGKYLITTNFFGATIKLYELNMHFVEVYYHPVLNKVMRVSIAHDEEMKKHLALIQLPI
jgi:hypothetical protein